MMYTLRFDGLFRGFPGSQGPAAKAGFMCYGWLISKNEQVIARGYGAAARGVNATSNIAEYLALIEGLDALLDAGLQDSRIEVYGDAKCVIEQMQGVAAVNAASIKPLYRRASRLADQFSRLTWRWTPRQHNKAADFLTRLAMRQIRQDRNQYMETAQAMDPKRQGMKRSNKLLSLLDLRVYLSPAKG